MIEDGSMGRSPVGIIYEAIDSNDYRSPTITRFVRGLDHAVTSQLPSKSFETSHLSNMATTVQQLMTTFSPQPLDTDTNTPVSRKSWTEGFFPFEPLHVTIWPPTVRAIDEFLGPGQETPSTADYVGLQTEGFL